MGVRSVQDAIPDHQFGFRHHHGTPEQAHRVVQHILDAFENKQYSSAIFLDVKEAFDRVWHDGLLYKLKSGKRSGPRFVHSAHFRSAVS